MKVICAPQALRGIDMRNANKAFPRASGIGRVR